MDSEHSENISHDDISDALARIITSQEFAKAYRLRQLLEHLVTKQLAGEDRDLKGYNIGLDVFEKGSNFDPDTDTIVRVQMVRLRRMLEHYYLKVGKNDAIIIEIPKGRYVPAYHKNTSSVDEQDHHLGVIDAANTLVRRIKQWLLSEPYLFALGLGTIILSFGLSYSLLPTIEEPVHEKTVMKRKIYRLPRGPSIAVLPFANETGKREHSLLIRGVPGHIIHTLTRFKELFIFAPDTTMAKRKSGDEQLEVARAAGADYALIGGFGVVGDQLSLSAYLMRVDSRQVVWSKNYKKKLTGVNFHQIQSDIAASVARQLGQPYGVINRLESVLHKQRERHGSGDFESYSAYECVLHFYEYLQRESEEKHLAVRTCLEETLGIYPEHAQAWAALSWMHVGEYRQDFNKKLHAKIGALDRAYLAAHKAVVLDPDDSFTHRRMASVLVSRGEVQEARKAIMLAAGLNPNDADVLADAGWILKNTGNMSEAFLYARKAIKLNPAHPPWYLETPTLYYYKNQDCKNAFRTAKTYHLLTPTSVLGEVLMIISGAICEHADVAGNVRVLNAKYPGFLSRPRKLLRDYVVPEELFSEIIEQLRDAGVKFTQ